LACATVAFVTFIANPFPQAFSPETLHAIIRHILKLHHVYMFVNYFYRVCITYRNG